MRNRWGNFYDEAEYGPYWEYGSDWPTAGISLLDDLEIGGCWTVATIDRAAEAFAGLQMFRQDLSPFDPVVRRDYQEYTDELGDSLHRMARRLFNAIIERGGSSDIELDTFPLDMSFQPLPDEARRRISRYAPAAEYAHLRALGLTVG